MAIIIGIIEPLKSLKAKLKSRGITRFKSIKEINEFLTNFNLEQNEILKSVTKKLDEKYSNTLSNLDQNNLEKNKIIYSKTKEINKKTIKYNELIFFIKNNPNNNLLINFIDCVKLYISKQRLKLILKNKEKIINSAVYHLISQIEKDTKFINEYNANKHLLIKNKAKSKIGYLKYTRNVIDECKNLIAGAIGENLVVQEIKKLSDDFTLINDFNLNFNSPIHYKNKRIKSIQIDHLLISKAGIFILETKNWSESSINSNNLNSPIDQILRFNFALNDYVSKNIKLMHLWGERKIPIRNIIVMIHNKPKSEFKFVEIKLLSELNNYITHFEPVFTGSDLKKILHKLT